MIAISKTCLKSLQNKNIWILRIIDGHIEFPYYMLFFDKSNKRSIKLETAVTWSKSNLNMMNIYEESTLNFWIWCQLYRGGQINWWRKPGYPEKTAKYTSPWTRFELITLVVIGTDCTCSCKSNYHKITTIWRPLQIIME
jgi:hypothetical protein